MAEFNRNLWAPWRMEYIHSLIDAEKDGDNDCFLCRFAQNPEDDGANHVIWRGSTCLTVFNRFPYGSGHLLIATLEHKADLDELDDPTLNEMIRQVRDAQKLLREVLVPQGFNIGANLGKVAGAGVEDHYHMHIVPRWGGDTNFMPVLGHTKVLGEGLEETWERLTGVYEQMFGDRNKTR